VPILLAATLLASATLAAPAAARADTLASDVVSALQDEGSSRSIESFYKGRDWRPLWTQDGQIGPAADELLHLVQSADLDGLKPRGLRPGKLDDAIAKARSGSPKALARAEMLLSETFAAYVQATRQLRNSDMHYASEALAPTVPTAKAALEQAAAASSLQDYVTTMGWMHPYYRELRRALADPQLARDQRKLLRLNLERARAIPGYPADRYVLVDTAAARLWMYEKGKVRGSMRVVVGKPDLQTPMIAGFLRTAILNPYWNVPPDLVAHTIAPNVLNQGVGYLKERRYQILSDWSDEATVVAPDTVDWKAVAAGQTELRVRQLPGKDNFMGNVKFMFPNELGIFLHDTPDKQLLEEAKRQLSSGCVRLEKPALLGTWLFGRPLTTKSKKPELQVPLPEPVPVYITYMTAAPVDGKIAFRPDVYNRDGTALAELQAKVWGTR
jgi:murein L,D-transpeptidase YcbB/YkuD